MKLWCVAATTALALCLAVGTVRAAPVLLSDNFNSENGGVGALNYNAFANWNVTDGTVDLIGNGFRDFLPGNGLYVDLDGSTRDAGLFASKLVFPVGSYAVQFDLAGSQRGSAEDVTVTLGDYSEVFHTLSTDPFTTVVRNITTTTAGALTFQNAGGDNVGALLDNVVVSVPSPAVPEPGPLALLAGLGVSMGGLLVRRCVR